MLVKFLVKLNEKWLLLTSGNKKEWWRKCLLNAAEEKLHQKKKLQRVSELPIVHKLFNFFFFGVISCAGVGRTILVFILIYFYFLSYCYSHLFIFWCLKYCIDDRFPGSYSSTRICWFVKHCMWIFICFMELFMFFIALCAVLHITNNDSQLLC